MAFVPGWRPLAAGWYWRAVAPAAGRSFRPELPMRPRLGRLKQRADFLRVAAARAKYAAPGVVLQIARCPVDAATGLGIRLGFTASRKVGNAVQRNRVRRRLKAAADQVMPLVARPGFDYVLIGRDATLTREFADLKSDIELAVRKAAGRGSGPGAGQKDDKRS